MGVKDRGSWVPSATLAAYALSLAALTAGSYLLVPFFGPGRIFGNGLLALTVLPPLLWLGVVLASASGGMPGRKPFLALGGIAAISSLVSYPFQSLDSIFYLAATKLTASYGLGPYDSTIGQALIDHPTDSLLQILAKTMDHSGFTYGYVFYGYMRTLWLLAFGNPVVVLYMHKGLMLAAAVGCGLLAAKLDEALAEKSGRVPLGRGWWLLMVTLNPLVLIEGVANGHNDIVLVLMVMLVFLLLLQKRPGLAVIAFTLALQWKLPVLLLAPFLLIWAWREGIRPRWKIFAYAGGMAASFLPYWLFFGVKGMPPGLADYASSMNRGALLRQVLLIMPDSGPRDAMVSAFTWAGENLLWPSLLLLVVLYAWRGKPGVRSLMAWSSGGYLLYLCVFSAYVWPWYFLWLIPFLPLLPPERQRLWVPVFAVLYVLQFALFRLHGGI